MSVYNSGILTGLEISEGYFRDCVQPMMERCFPKLEYAAALIGDGSEVLGFDTALSKDHSWGPRLFLFVSDDAIEDIRKMISAGSELGLPEQYRGYPTEFHCSSFEAAGVMQYYRGVAVTSVQRFFGHYLGINPLDGLSAEDWLMMQENKLLGATSGMVFHDSTGELGKARSMLRYYPRDIWLYLMASRWCRIGEERAFIGRCGDVGDDLGSRIVAARLVKELMGLCFLFERAYAPYAKWFGTAFRRLHCADRIYPLLEAVLGAAEWKERERALLLAYTAVIELHNELHVTAPMDAKVDQYFSRPYLVVDSDAIAEALLSAIEDEQIRSCRPIGSVNQFLDQTNLLCDAQMCRRAGIFFK